MRFIPFLFITAISAGCFTDTRTMPAVGLPGDVYVVMDSAQWLGPLGRTIDSLFSVDMPGLPRKEPIFQTKWIDPRKFSSTLKQRRNIILVLTLEKNTVGSRRVRKIFTPESIEKIKTNPSEFSTTSSDPFARGQEVLYLYGINESALIANLRSGGSKLPDYFDQRERQRLIKSMFKSGQVTGVSNIIKSEFGCELQIPLGYKVADQKEDFIWARQINPRDDKNIFVARKAYTSQKDFGIDELIKYRDEICRKYLFEDPDKPETYMLTETTVPFIPVTADTINFNGHFAVRLRGLYRSNTMGMGGPFTALAVVDQGTQQFYYIEGFTFAPGKEQREIMRELEAILYTFKTSKEIKTE